jgi:hypothetical protein
MHDKLQAELDLLDSTADTKANKMIKAGIFLTGVQFGVLFYLTYWVWDWDTCEPLDYLLGCTLETIGLYMFIQYRKDMSQDDCYEDTFEKYYGKKVEGLSSYLEKDLKNL